MNDGAALLEIEGWRPPPAGRAFFCETEDGARLRGAYWSGRGRGLAVILQGRTEFIEKYYGVAQRLLERGYDVATLDWRGQGLSDRVLDDRRKGHVADFAAYQRDLDAFMAALASEGAPGPDEAARIMIAHSMGGAIGARALMRQHAGAAPHRFAAAIFSAPMLRLAAGLGRSIAMRLLARLNRLAGRGKGYVAGYGPTSAAERGYEDNPLTSDKTQYETNARMLGAHPELAIGGPTWEWLAAALTELAALRPTPTPVMTVCGLEDAAFAREAAHAYAAATPKGRALEIAGARHEPFFAAPPHQDRLWGAGAAFLDEIGL